jgi:hypothetical protein
MKWMSLVLVTFLSCGAWASIDEKWESNSDPEIMSYFFTRQFPLLPLEGSVYPSTKYWSGDYWALRKGNINYRWFAKKKVGFNLNSPTKEEARRMTVAQLAELSPSEKYDLYTGRYDYPLRNEVNRIADPSAAEWEGICHGWSPATINHDEPLPKLMRNPDGIEIPFGSSDIKALLSYYYAYGYKIPNTHQMGRRCFRGSFFNRSKDCWDDMNAGAFHIVLANRVGIEGRSFIMDLERYREVWNHPVTDYKSRVLRETPPWSDSAPGTKKVIEVETLIHYLDDNGNDWNRVMGTPKQMVKKVTYRYLLDIDENGAIIGGKWMSTSRPDFLWYVGKVRKFEGTLWRLGDLL